MRTIREYKQYSSEILNQRSTHILCLGFEDRCLAYPTFLAETSLRSDKHTFLCVVPADDGVGGALIERRKQHKAKIETLLNAVQFVAMRAVGERVQERVPPENFFLDISSMPRSLIFETLSMVMSEARQRARIFIIYASPKVYAHGCLQQPAPDMSPYFDWPRLARETRATAIIIPGFDREFTNVALTYITASTGEEPEVRWCLHFPGRKYAFYQRSMENHIELIGKNALMLYPFDEIGLSAERLKREITDPQRPMFLVPLGPRISCVSVFLAVSWAQKERMNVNVLLPMTKKYTSLRSEGCEEPSIEQIYVSSGSTG